MPKQSIHVTVRDKQGVVYGCTADEPSRAGEVVRALVELRSDVDANALVGLLLEICASMPGLHPLMKVKLMAVCEVMTFYIPEAMGGKARHSQPPLHGLVDQDNDFPF